MNKDKKKISHTIYYSAEKMAQHFDNLYFNTAKYKTVKPLDNDTDLVRHTTELSGVFKTLLHRMRMIAKTNYTLKESLEKKRPRIQFCGYSVNGNSNMPISLCRSVSGSLFFNGIANCGGYWRCPVCALKISENKKQLLSGLVEQHHATGGRVGFVTLTIRHSKNLSLKGVLDKLLCNYRAFQNTRDFSRGKKPVGYIGQVKTLEITWSKENGWHPHLHLLYFFANDNEKEITTFQRKTITNWVKYRTNNATVAAQDQKIISNLIPDDIAAYVSKFDIAAEMTKGTLKGSKGLTAFTALGKIALDDYENYEEKRLLYGLYSTYVEYTQGKHFVGISRELSKRYQDYLKPLDKTDDEIVNEVEIDEVLLKISVDLWKKVAKNDLQPLIINQFRENGLDGVYNLLTRFKDFQNIEIEQDKDDLPVII